jgi:crotonobetainyl-CoA:carnitine CoA-transferase CaiB-like acyl-CoA transferase
LKSAGDRATLDDLLATTDILISSNRPSALVRLGLGAEDLDAKFPKLCHVAIVGYAAPYEDIPGHDLTYQAQLGLVAPPSMPRTLIADLAGAQEAVITALAMLRQREKTGRGGTKQVSLADAAETFALPVKYGLTTPTGPLGGTLPGYNIYAAAEGWIAVAALEPHFLEKLRQELDLASPTREDLARIFLTRTASEWEEWAEPRGLPISALK